LREFAGRIFSDRHYYLLRHDTTTPMTVPRAQVPITLRSLRSEDIPLILTERRILHPILHSGLSTCYVSTTLHGEICHVQWLIDPSQNQIVARKFSEVCPVLANDETLLGWSYVFRRFHGMGIMGAATAQICQMAAAAGAHWVFIFVAVGDTVTLNICRRIGFQPHQIRTDSWRLFRLTPSFEQFSR
jgi:hypothetical protein